MGLVTRLAGSLNFDVAAACGIVLVFRYFMRSFDSLDGHGLLVGGLEYFSEGLKPSTRLLLLVESLLCGIQRSDFLHSLRFLVIQQSFGVHSELIPRKRLFLMLVALLPQLFVVGSGSVILHSHGRLVMSGR